MPWRLAVHLGVGQGASNPDERGAVAHTGAKVIIGGLNTGPDNAIRYVRAVQTRLGGRLPVDALAIHPYGRFVKTVMFNFGSIGRLSDSLNRFKSAFPDKPIRTSPKSATHA